MLEKEPSNEPWEEGTTISTNVHKTQKVKNPQGPEKTFKDTRKKQEKNRQKNKTFQQPPRVSYPEGELLQSAKRVLRLPSLSFSGLLESSPSREESLVLSWLSEIVNGASFLLTWLDDDDEVMLGVQ